MSMHLQWFQERLSKLQQNYGILTYYEGSKLVAHWTSNLDEGAVRTLYNYLHKLPHAAFLYVTYRYTFWCFNEASSKWDVRIPSAALVSVIRYTYWCDEEFQKEFLSDDS